MKKILILGIDGYLGWSVTKSLIAGDYIILGIDSGLRRKLVNEVGSDSLTPIQSLSDRVKETRRENITVEQVDICNTTKIFEIFERFSPDIVFNCAQQASAPYSMIGVNEANFTLTNNEVGNMNVLWAIKQFCRDALYVKLGSFGEYASTNIEVPEGYFAPEYKGKKSDTLIPFPRKSGDFYHASKSNDSNYLAVAADCWNLRIVELMQSTIFGCRTSEIDNEEKLLTRFDYDQYFGTVINRFIVQALLGRPLTVYGKGTHRTGVMSLAQSVSEITSIFRTAEKYTAGHTVINNSPSVDFTVKELADLVSECAKQCGINCVTQITLDQRGFDPRNESKISAAQRRIQTSNLVKVESKDDFALYLAGEVKFLQQYISRCNKDTINPTLEWRK